MAKRKSKRIPAYRLHKRSGQAIVTLTDANTGHRRDVYLGEYGSTASRKQYADVLARWEEAGRILDGSGKVEEETRITRSVRGVAVSYWLHVKQRYAGRSSSHRGDIHTTMKLLRSCSGQLPAIDFGPKKLAEVREAMIEQGWSRATITKRTGFIRAAFKHALAIELIPPHHAARVAALDALPSLPPGYKGIAEPKKVLPVPAADIAAVLDRLPSPVRGIVEVMRYTGARCDEVTRLTPAMLDTTGDVWRAELADHKNTHRGKARIIWMGPKAQKAVKPFLRREVHKPLFSPSEADSEVRAKRRAERKTPESCGNRPGTNRKAEPKTKPGERYTTASVRRCIERACDAAGIDRWTPHRLRHTAATELRKAAGLEAAAVVLGHSSATLTDAVYAERDEATAHDVLRRIG